MSLNNRSTFRPHTIIIMDTLWIMREIHLILKKTGRKYGLDKFRTLLNFGGFKFRTSFCPKLKTSEIFGH